MNLEDKMLIVVCCVMAALFAVFAISVFSRQSNRRDRDSRELAEDILKERTRQRDSLSELLTAEREKTSNLAGKLLKEQSRVEALEAQRMKAAEAKT